MSEEAIAARHFVTPAILKQRLRLPSVSPKLHEVYPAYDRPRVGSPFAVSLVLTPMSRRVVEHDDGGWLQHAALLDRLVTENLKTEAETIAAEVRPEDELRAADSDIGQNVDASSNGGQQAGASAQRTVISVAVAPTEAEEDHEDAAKPLPGRLITELTAHPTLALRDALAENAVNALYEPANRYNQGHVSTHNVRTRLDQADVLACAVGLDMVQAGWKSKVDNDLGRVTKPRILEAVREAKGESSAQLIDHLKKGDTAKEAERLLNGSGWLPEPLRLADVASVPADQEGEAGPLPDFLSEDEGRDIAANDQPECEAAE
jgi:hypothetical protein